MNLKWMMVAVVTAAMLVAPNTAADPVVSVSGMCYDGNGNGGSGAIIVGDDGSVNAFDADELVSIVTALALFGTESGNDVMTQQSTGDACEAPDCNEDMYGGSCNDDNRRADYLNVYVAGESVCYAGKSDPNGGDASGSIGQANCSTGEDNPDDAGRTI